MVIRLGMPAVQLRLAGRGGEGTALSGLSAGDCPFTFTDGRGRSYETLVSVGQTAALSLHTFVVAASSSASEDGSIYTSVTTGLPPYQYLWSTGATSTSLTGLAPGKYSLTVTDGAVCEHQYFFEVQYASFTSEVPQSRKMTFRPNPASQLVEIHWAHAVPAGSYLTLVDVAGRAVKSVAVERSTQVQAFSLVDCPAGAYLLCVVEKGKVVAREKLVVLAP